MSPDLIAIIGAIASVIGVIVAIIAVVAAVAQAIPAWHDYRTKKLLNKKFRRGQYDEQTIERSTRYYIRPKCSNLDPAQEQEIRHALFVAREDLFTKVDYFLDHDELHRHLLILADSGMGKTSFVLNYYAHNERRWMKKHTVAIIPLGVKDSENLIQQIPDKEETIIFLDALDEDTKAIEDHHVRIRYLMDLCRFFKKVIITCRTQFFLKDEEIPVETGIIRVDPKSAGDKGIYEFWKIYLSPLDDDEVKKYIYKRYSILDRKNRKKALQIALRIPMLSARPMLLSHIPDIITRKTRIVSTSDLYESMINAWIDRESAWISKEDLREISERLAVNIYIHRERRGMEGIPFDDLLKLVQEWNIKLESWKISGRSLLNRDAQGNYKFAHRSIMEYLFVRRIIKQDNDTYNIILTDQMKIFLLDRSGLNEVIRNFVNSTQISISTIISPTKHFDLVNIVRLYGVFEIKYIEQNKQDLELFGKANDGIEILLSDPMPIFSPSIRIYHDKQDESFLIEFREVVHSAKRIVVKGGIKISKKEVISHLEGKDKYRKTTTLFSSLEKNTIVTSGVSKLLISLEAFQVSNNIIKEFPIILLTIEKFGAHITSDLYVSRLRNKIAFIPKSSDLNKFTMYIHQNDK